MKSRFFRADGVSVMENNTPTNDDPSASKLHTEPKQDTDRIAVSAEDLVRLIHSGQGDDLNELIRQTLDDRLAA